MVNQKRIAFPLSQDTVLSLSAGNAVLISGQIVTGRDKVHQYLFNEEPPREELPCDLVGSLLYHCGPIVRKTNSEYKVVACGPTTSARLEMFEGRIIEKYGLRAIMGKGGMGTDTLTSLKRFGAVYLHAVGGAAAYLAERVRRVIDVWKLEEFGIPEAMWVLEVEDFPAIVTMDANGNSLHDRIIKESEKAYLKLIGSDR